ncbi:RHS repeat domain-containing protein [Vibrio rhizosphaerae]|uniref:RHS repeat domain-containing protein n=1 Tax=Vibrio rhizosphaerae TaxID=398736 RepID=UPI0021C32A58|nr:RHS repeat-associated core domain-containing protein [Vibrio rhizosphaerae]
MSGLETRRTQGALTSHFQYDEFGNLIQEARGTQQSLVTTYAYDCQHRLIRVEKPDGSSAEYRYDAFGRRIHKAVTDKTGQTRQTEFLWQGDKLLAESGERHYQTYLYEYGSFKPLALVTGEGADNATPYFYHLDQIGTPLEITDATGAVAWSVDYHSYGNVAYQRKAQIVSPLRFQGQYYDAETGLHYNRHRYYSPGTGRFITPDPIGLAGGLNNYQYVKNPTGWVDPLGLMMKACQGLCKLGVAQHAKTSKGLYHNAWNEFQKDHAGQFKTRAEASKAYQDLIQNESPWPYGYTPAQRTIQPGETFNMAVAPIQPVTSPGGFGTIDTIPNSNYVWNELAVKRSWKPQGVDRVVTYKVDKPFEVLEGPVGPQVEVLSDGKKRYIPGGGSQLQLLLPRDVSLKMKYLRVEDTVKIK